MTLPFNKTLFLGKIAKIMKEIKFDKVFFAVVNWD